MISVEKGTPTDIIGSASAFTTLGAPARSSIIDVGLSPRITLEVYLNAAAIGNIMEIVPLICSSSAQPAAGDDVWVAPGVWDGTVTVSAGATPVSGSDWTTSPGFGVVEHNPISLRTRAATGATDKIRMSITLNVENARWLFLQFDQVDAGTAPTAWVRYVLHGK